MHNRPIFFFAIDCLAVARAHFKIYTRYPGWIIGNLFGPIFLIAPWVFMGKLFVGHSNQNIEEFSRNTGTTNYVGFLVTGLVLWSYTFTVLSHIGEGLRREQLGGTLEHNLATPMSPVALIVGKSIAHVLFWVLFVLETIFLCWVLFRLKLQINMLSAAVVLGLTMLNLYGFAFLYSSLILWVRETFVIQRLLVGAIASLCGASFSVSLFPGWLQTISRLIPLTWSFECFRAATLKGVTIGEIQGGLIVLSLFATLFLVSGHLIFKRTLSYLKRSGNLGIY